MKLFDKWLKDSKEWDKKYGVTTGIFKIMSDSNTKYLEKENQKLKAQLEVVMEALNELTTSCTHDEDDGNFRKLGDWYGWCSLCGTKVGYKKNIGRDAFKKIEEIENSTNKENK